jgi:hypothetical protein
MHQSDPEVRERLRSAAEAARHDSSQQRNAMTAARRSRAKRPHRTLVAQDAGAVRMTTDVPTRDWSQRLDSATVMKHAQDVRRDAILVRRDTAALRGSLAWEVRRLDHIRKRINGSSALAWHEADVDTFEAVLVPLPGGGTPRQDDREFALLSVAALADLLISRLDQDAVAELADPSLAGQLRELRTQLDAALRR